LSLSDEGEHVVGRMRVAKDRKEGRGKRDKETSFSLILINIQRAKYNMPGCLLPDENTSLLPNKNKQISN
jgi:hypothetical protein